MVNCDSGQVNNLTRKKALQNIDLMHHLSNRISQTRIIHALFPCTLDSLSIHLSQRNKHTFLHGLLAVFNTVIKFIFRIILLLSKVLVGRNFFGGLLEL